MKKHKVRAGRQVLELSEKDICRAMEEVSGYVDITPDDFKEIYRHAFQHAHQTLSTGKKGTRPVVSPGAGAAAGFSLKKYFHKMKGLEKSPPRVGASEIGWSWAGAFLGIAAVAVVHFNLLTQTDLSMVIGSFGASAVLLYGAVKSPLAQPRNLIGGHMLSALVGVASYRLLFFSPWLASAAAVATAIALMHATKTLHPPGGATALIAVIGSQKIHALGYLYVFIPAGLGALIMLAVALAVNNLAESRKYPEFWW